MKFKVAFEKLLAFLLEILDKLKTKLWNNIAFWKILLVLLILAIGFGWYLGTGKLLITLTVGERTAVIGGQAILLSGTPTLIDGRLYVPARSIFEAIGATIEWNQETGQATMQMPKVILYR